MYKCRHTCYKTCTKFRYTCHDTCTNADIRITMHVRNSGIHAMIHLRNSPIHAVTKSSQNPIALSSSCLFPYSHRFHITPPQFREPYKTSLWEKDMHSHKKGTVDSTYPKIRHACYDTCTNADIHVITHVRYSGIHAMIHVRMQTYVLQYMYEIQAYMP